MAKKKKATKKSVPAKGTPKRKAKSSPKTAAPKKGVSKKDAPKKSAAKKSAPVRPQKPIGPVLIGAGALCLVVAVVAIAQRQPDEESAEVSTVTLPERSSPDSPMLTTIPEALEVRVHARRAHQPDAFTQGLLWHDGRLYESTGLEGRSSVRRVNPLTGEVERQLDLDEQIFAEGLARVDDRLVQITWQDGLAFVYDLETFEKRAEFEYEGEGWGLCYDGTRLIMSDGSDELFFRDPDTFEEIGHVAVTKAGRPLRRLNELECVDGVVYANIWQRNEIVRIDPTTGRVTATIRVEDLLEPHERRGIDVLNGIAYMPDSGHFMITGKLWPAAFEVSFEPR